MRIAVSLFAAPLVLAAARTCAPAARSGGPVPPRFDARCAGLASGQRKGQLQ